jgi:hypothetical protein
MSSTRQAVIPLPSFTGAGKRPDFTPAHQVDFATGMGPAGPRMTASRTKPSFGNERTLSVGVTDRVWLSVRTLFIPNAFGWIEHSEGRMVDSENPRGFAELRKFVSIFLILAFAPAGSKMPGYSVKAQFLLAALL